MEESYDIQQSITTRSKWNALFDMQDFLLCILYGIILMKISAIFPEKLFIYVFFLNMAVAVFLIMPSKANAKMKQGYTLMRVLFFRGKTYHAIDAQGLSKVMIEEEK